MTDETAAPANVAQFVDAAKRLAEIPLEYPVAFAGKVYRKVVLKRMTGQDVSAYIEQVSAIAKDDADKHVRFPIYFDEDGAAMPDAVLDSLDADDSEAVQKRVLDFLPRSFRGTLTPEAV